MTDSRIVLPNICVFLFVVILILSLQINTALRTDGNPPSPPPNNPTRGATQVSKSSV